MKHLLFILTVVCITGCVTPIKYTPTCQSYQQLIDESWTFNKAKQIYTIQGPAPAKSIAQVFDFGIDFAVIDP